MIGLLALTAFAALLLYAACSDLARLTIPNWVSITLAGLFVPAALAAGVPLAQIGAHLLFGAAMLAGGFFLFQANIIGGGDAKLLAGAAVWTGVSAFTPFIFWTAVAGGLLALSLIAARRCLKQAATNPAFVNRLLERETGVPYALAIMTGGLMALPALSLALGPAATP